LLFLGTGKLQPADVGLNRVIKHRLKQSQMKYLIEVHQKQIATGLTPEQVKFSTSLPVLRDASVAGIFEVYDFMTGPAGHQLIKKVRTIYWANVDANVSFRLGKDAPPKSGIFLVNV
jgi:hypothetical protein